MMAAVGRLLVILSAAGIFLIGRHSALAQDAVPPLPGDIAYIGADFNVYSIARETNTRTQLTFDAGIGADSGAIYQFPTWSTDGRLAYFQTAVTRERGVTTRVFIAPDGRTPGEARYETDEKNFTYAYWSPRNCASDSSCRDLAVLMGTRGGFNVDIVRDDAEPDVRTVGGGSPFYFSWSPDGGRMLWHRNQARIDVYDPAEGGSVTPISTMPGTFAAPSWSPVDDRLLYAVANGTSSELVIMAGAEPEPIVSGLSGPVSFAWSPDGNQIAYVDRQTTLTVIDATSGEVVARPSVTGVLAFFWSPDGKRIAYLSLASPPGSFSAFDPKGELTKALAQGGANGIVWSVLDVQTSQIRRYGTFIPTRDMVYLLTYYDQFSQSHRVWSPDSSYLLYSEISPEGREMISLLDTTQPVSVPLTIADGSIAIWSFN